MATAKKPQNKKTSGKKTDGARKSSAPKVPAKKSDYSFLGKYILCFFAIFLIITFFPRVDTGLLGNIRVAIKGVFGYGYYLFPFFMLFAVCNWNRDRQNNAQGVRNFLTVAVFVFSLIIVHLVSVRMQKPEVYSEAVKDLKDLYASGKELKTGGLIGGSICALIAKGIGWVATTVLASLGIFVCIVLLCGSTPMATLRAIARFFRNLIERIREQKAAKEAEEALLAEQEEERRKQEALLLPAKEKEKEKKLPAPKPVKATVTAADSSGQQRFVLPEETLPNTEPKKETPAPVKTPAIPREEPEERVWVAIDTSKDEPVTLADDADEVIVPPPAEEIPEELPPLEEISTAEEIPTIEEPTEETVETVTVAENVPPPYVFPPISLLTQDEGNSPKPSGADVATTSRKLESVLESFKVKARVIGASFGPTVTQYEVQPEVGVRVKQIANLADDIALHLAASSVRIENIPGKSAIGVEIPNRAPAVVRLRSLIENSTFKDSKSKLITALGEDVSGNPVYMDIGKMPHLMIAGATGMGKSVCMNALIVSLLYHASPTDVKFIMIDPKKVEMADYNGIPHLLVPVINDAKKAAGTLNWACVEMEKRYNLIQEVNAKNLVEYNNIVKDDPEREQQPYIVIFIDELADLMMTAPDDVETSICRLAQKARAAGIHLVIGTQRPSVDVITGLIKANVPSRIAFTVASQVDSRTILDMAGAEKLLGRGDMLYYPVGAMKPIRVQGALVDGKTEVVAITDFIKNAASASYDESVIEEIEKEAKLCGQSKHAKAAMGDGSDGGNDIKLDEKFLEALELAIDTQNISTSMIQTRLGLGYARAARIVGVMEQKGFIGPFDSATKKRQILITREELNEMRLANADPDAQE